MSDGERTERTQILDRIRPKLIALKLPLEFLQEVLTRLALTEIDVLREIEAEGIPGIVRRAGMARRTR